MKKSFYLFISPNVMDYILAVSIPLYIHARHTSMEYMCAYLPKVNFQNKWKNGQKILSYRIVRIKLIFPEFIDV